MFFPGSKKTESTASLKPNQRVRRIEPLESRQMMTSVYADFNGDGFDDLAIGVPGEDIGSIRDAGAVNVIYGGKQDGLHAGGNQYWHQDSPGIRGISEAYDKFGSSIVAGDFNGDGYDDLAIGSPRESIAGKTDAGAINVIYGSAENGLHSKGNQFFHQNSKNILGRVESYDYFGNTLASGDFNGDGIDDLAIGVCGEDWFDIRDAGSVNVIYGSRNDGLTWAGNRVFTQGYQGTRGRAEKGDQFGSSLSAGDFNRDGKDDLAIGVPFEDWGKIVDAGSVNVVYGSRNGLQTSNDQEFTQGYNGLGGRAEKGDQFGQSLASGDFNGDGRDDLAIGAPKEDWYSITDAGCVNVVYGTSSGGLNTSGNQVFSQDTNGIQGKAKAFDKFGFSLAAGDFNGDGADDLAIGIPDDDFSGHDAGGVNVIYGARSQGLVTAGNQLVTQNTQGIHGVAESSDYFGTSLTAGDFNGDGRVDLAIGVPREGISSKLRAGSVNVIYGVSAAGLGAAGNQFWNQNSQGIIGEVEAYDFFGRFRGEFWNQF